MSCSFNSSPFFERNCPDTFSFVNTIRHGIAHPSLREPHDTEFLYSHIVVNPAFLASLQALGQRLMLPLLSQKFEVLSWVSHL